MLSNIARALSAECRFYFDEEARDQVFELIRVAKTSLHLVSPYNKHPQQLKERLNEAIERGVQVTMLFRDEKDQREGVAYLERLGAKVLPVEWLHSKIYMNESTALASSMNLLDSSFNNSSEFCIRIDKANVNNGRLYSQLAEYVDRIELRARRQNPSASTDKSDPARPAAPRPARARAFAKSAAPRRSAPKVKAASATGHCIRCGVGIPLNAEKPLCVKDFRSWNRHHNPDFEENYCHRCGEQHDTSMAEPLCHRCSQVVSRARQGRLPTSIPPSKRLAALDTLARCPQRYGHHDGFGKIVTE